MSHPVQFGEYMWDVRFFVRYICINRAYANFKQPLHMGSAVLGLREEGWRNRLCFRGKDIRGRECYGLKRVPQGARDWVVLCFTGMVGWWGEVSGIGERSWVMWGVVMDEGTGKLHKSAKTGAWIRRRWFNHGNPKYLRRGLHRFPRILKVEVVD